MIVDSGGANLASLQYALGRAGAPSHVSSDGSIIASAERVILPGVGAAADAMARLRAHGLISVLRTLTQPTLGICLGMQLLFSASEEGRARCLGLLPDTVQKLIAAPGRPVPHMGWNQLEARHDNPLLEGIQARDYVYFAHSYAPPVGGYTLACTDYTTRFSAVIRWGNFCGTQFHPERSGRVGARLLENFLRL